MPRQADDVPEIAAGLPAWAASVAMRLEFYAERGHPELRAPLMAAVRSLRALTADANANLRALDRFMRACLDRLGEAAHTRDEFAAIRNEIDTLCSLARKALETDRDDRPLLARTQELEVVPDAASWAAANVSGRVVFLAAMAEHVPDEVGVAAVMLVNASRLSGSSCRCARLRPGLRKPGETCRECVPHSSRPP
jgi:hypothetical protein